MRNAYEMYIEHNYDLVSLCLKITYSAIAIKPFNGMIPQKMPIIIPNTCRDQ